MPTAHPLLDRTGVFLFTWGKTPPTALELIDMAVDADSRGFHSVHVPYFFALDTNKWNWGNASVVDALTVLPVMGQRTETLVNLSHFNFSMLHPYVWAQYLSSLDVATRGRAMTTLAMGTREADFQVGLSPREDALDRMTEGFGAFRDLLDGGEVTSASRFWDFEDLRVNPSPDAEVPLWVSGESPELVDIAARYAHYIKPSGMGPTRLRESFTSDVAAAGERHGRSIGIAMSVLVYITQPDDPRSLLDDVVHPLVAHERPGGRVGEEYVMGTPEECAEQLVALFAAGVDYLALDLNFHGWAPHTMASEQVARFAELVAPLVSESDLPPLRPVSR